jgi:hypothetical protein
MRTAATLALLPLLIGGCMSRKASTPEEIEAALQGDAKNVVRRDAFTLFSPYDAAATADYASVVDAQTSLVRPVFDDPGTPAVNLYLVPLPDDAEAPDPEPWLGPSRDGWAGAASPTGFAFIYVRRSARGSAAAMQATLSARALRHELAHVYARRAGLSRAAWFNEGLAREVELMREEGAKLQPHVFPPALIAARESASAGTVQELLQWKLDDGASLEVRALRYDEAQSLFRFLVARQADGDWLQRARVVLALPDAQIVALEPEWLSWLASLDALEAIRRGVRSTSAGERDMCASLLPILAEQGARELCTHAADELALELVSGRMTSSSAATFLLFFRARALTEEEVAGLSASSDPTLCQTGLALRARRGEPFDLQRAQAAWDGVQQPDRTYLVVQRNLIPGLVDRGSSR